MDEKDREILEILREDGRASYTEIAEQLDVSEGTVRNRVENMKEDGTIEKFTVETSNNDISAVVLTKLETSQDPEKVIEQLPEGLKVHEVTGEHDLVINLDREETEQINDAIDEIRKIEGVRETVTKSVLRETET
ncbi:MAG: Lrp/AsnC family transcriptional regulator [Candidatus Nanohalobium sp.]